MRKVLLVEDENLIRRGLLYKVDWVQVNCAIAGEAATGEEGLEKIRALHPDIVITDIRMPDMDGLEMLRLGRQECRFSAVILSGYSEFAYAREAIHLGVVEYLLKPVDIGELKSCLLRIGREQVPQAPVPETLPEAEPSAAKNKYVAIMLTYIREHYAEPISLTDLSQELNISCTHLNAKFKEEMGDTFHSFLNRYRIRRAMELQNEGKYKLLEIAEMVGFSDYKYFNRVFKKHTGFSPNVLDRGWEGEYNRPNGPLPGEAEKP